MSEYRLYEGDNLDILRLHVEKQSIDLVYLDPPFNSNANYLAADTKAFSDAWRWTALVAESYQAFVSSSDVPNAARRALSAFHDLLSPGDMLAYLVMMTPRIIEIHRVLKATGSLYLHCDPSASHTLRLLLDAIFGPEHFQSEIIWKRTHAHGSAKRYGPVHDVILFYSKSEAYLWRYPQANHSEEYLREHFKQVDAKTGRTFQAITLTGSGIRRGESGNPWKGVDPTNVQRHWAIPGKVVQRLGIEGATVQDKLDALDTLGRIYWPNKEGGTPRLKWFADELDGVSLADIWSDIPPLSANAAERLGYPTQKPLALLERIIGASSNEGDTVLDPFCGCGTTLAAAQKMGRRWIGIDVSPLAISMTRGRLPTESCRIPFER